MQLLSVSVREEKHNKPKHKSCVSNLDLEVGRDGGSAAVPGRLVPSSTAGAFLATLHPERTQPGSPVHPQTSMNLPWAGQGDCELVSLTKMGPSYISVPQFLFVHGGITALPCCRGQCGSQPRNPSHNTSATGHPPSVQPVLCFLR